MTITSVIVTYANRFTYLKQVLVSCIEQHVTNIVIVDNNSDSSSKNKLIEFSKNKNQIHIITNKCNVGSAKGFTQGMQFAKSLTNDYILLLDDDNKLEDNCISVLKETWIKKSSDVAALLCYRPDRSQFKKAIQQKNPNLVLGAKNSFSGFHILEKLKKFFGKVTPNDDSIRQGIVACAPYGGMFFPKKILQTVSYPKEHYFLYVDDHDWSYQFTKKNYKILLLLDAVVRDIETSWSVNKKQNFFKNMNSSPHLRVYYSIRNRVLFEKENLVTNLFIYKLNEILFTFFMFLYTSKNEVYKVYLRALKDAKEKNLDKF